MERKAGEKRLAEAQKAADAKLAAAQQAAAEKLKETEASAAAELRRLQDTLKSMQQQAMATEAATAKRVGEIEVPLADHFSPLATISRDSHACL